MADALPVNGVGYVLFNAPITTRSRDLFIADIDKLHNAGAREIRLGINSGGGDIDAAQGMVDYMRRLHNEDGVTFQAYNVGFVASAATYVFLNAQDRYAAGKSTFLFHAAAAVSAGPVTSEGLREEASRLDAYEGLMLATMKARTHLTSAEAQTYVRRTVLLNVDDARRDGIIDAVSPMSLPKGARAWVIHVIPPPGTPPAAKPAAAPPPSPG